MNIGLINLEPNIINTALMQIAKYHRDKGDCVEWSIPLTESRYDRLYCSSLFSFTDKRQVPSRAICGGTGHDLTTNLPEEIEKCGYDYSIYPSCDYSIVWFSRGCIRKCPFCVVWEKEGKIQPVDPKPLNPAGKHIKIQDNNFFANPQWKEAVRYLRELKQPVAFASGLDVRIFDDQQGNALKSLRLHGRMHVAWDNPKDDLTPKLEHLTQYIKHYKVMCYVLIGYWSTPEEDLFRIETLKRLKIDPFVMPYNKSDPYQKRFARWVNHKAIFKSVEWKNYR